ncbi:MAG: SpoIIE family protein phosphatase [bacterium]|nr:SpoIIE family protein phosphatase [bacterium]
MFKFDSGTGAFQQPKGSELLSDAEINAILEDNGGNLWLSSAEGLFAFNPAGGTVKKYDAGDGLQANLFTHAAYRGRGGEMFFGGYNGFNVFHPGRIRDNLHVPPVVITGFRVSDRPVKIGAPGRDGRPILEKSITETRQIMLTYKDKIFSFQFAALDYTRPQKNRFAYKMEGFDGHWNYIGGRRFVTFTGLPPGTYTFRVKGSNNDGIWNETGTSLRILITPPWWRTGWAYALYIFSLAAGILGLNRLQRVRLLRKERDKAALREARLRARAAEAQARAVDAEHRRKTQELEDARILQLSMLPKRLPDLPGIGIAVYMKTATEVGGDYYDFYTGYDHSLTVAVGDATGHGLKAGTMVSIMKGIFMSEAGTLRRDIDAFFNKSSHTIKRMQLGNLFMGLTVVRLDDCRATVACAGMPPVYLYRGKKKIVEAINLKAPPLGAFEHIIYRHETIELQKGDTMLLFSDGLPELFNGDGEMFGYPRFKQLFREVGENAPRLIVDRLANAGEQWLSGKPRDDDITFVVLKIK